MSLGIGSPVSRKHRIASLAISRASASVSRKEQISNRWNNYRVAAFREGLENNSVIVGFHEIPFSMPRPGPQPDE